MDMEFSRLGKHTIRCVISEQEIADLGYTLDEIMSNGTRTQEFMNRIFDLAEQRFDTKFELGIKTVRADFMSDHTLALTFSEHPGANGMMEHLKDIIGGLLDSLVTNQPEGDLAEPEGGKEYAESFSIPEGVRIEIMLIFEDLDTLTRYAKLISMEKMPKNALYKFEGLYFLMLNLTDADEADVKRLSVLTDEYAMDIVVGAEKKAFVEEHGDVILKEMAIEQLKQL